ncbi:MAG TPA: porin [Prevotella sp.]|nr:porin [Prevotella sp.]
MKNRIMTLTTSLTLALTMNAQGNNTGMGGSDGEYQSLYERVTQLEKKNDMFNVYFNYAAHFQESNDGHEWQSAFKNQQARLEIKGNLTDKISYRFRHRLNKGNNAQSEDNFAKATDILMIGYQFSPKVGVQVGKMCQNWGGFEFDENPMFIYQYSDMVDNMDNFMAGINISYKVTPTQEVDLNITDANNGSFADEYGSDARSVEGDGSQTRILEKANHPLTYIVLWSGSFLGNKLQARWSYGLQTQAKHKYSREIALGEKLNLPTLQWYVDYMEAFDGLDRLKIATGEAMEGLGYTDANLYFSDVHYQSWITKVNWQFAPQWNLMVKGTYETANVSKIERLKNYRTSIGYSGSIEYYPDKSQDLRVFLAYFGHQYDYSKKCGLSDYHTNRIELGFMYRIKCF